MIVLTPAENDALAVAASADRRLPQTADTKAALRALADRISKGMP